ncbi:MAG TPA: hypothetical protein VHL34_14905 [Rhizomicrobium sp.]|nr:hypothetical protein [Rhizomicrobium sp.]
MYLSTPVGRAAGTLADSELWARINHAMILTQKHFDHAFSSSGQAEALLHLGAMAVLLGIGYLGLDRLHSGERPLERADTTHREQVTAWFLSVDIPIRAVNGVKEAMLNQFLSTRHVYVLLFICKIRVIPKPGVKLPVYFIFRQGYVPGLNYFRMGHHFVVMSILAMASSLAFISLVVLILRQSPIVDSALYQNIALFIFVATILMTWASTAVYYLLNRIMAGRIATLEKKVERLIEALKKAALPSAQNDEDNGNGAGQQPQTP